MNDTAPWSVEDLAEGALVTPTFPRWRRFRQGNTAGFLLGRVNPRLSPRQAFAELNATLVKTLPPLALFLEKLMFPGFGLGNSGQSVWGFLSGMPQPGGYSREPGRIFQRGAWNCQWEWGIVGECEKQKENETPSGCQNFRMQLQISECLSSL